MSALSLGLYRATVRGVADVTVLITDDGRAGFTSEYICGEWRSHLASDITDARPLIVLDLTPHHVMRALEALREGQGMVAMEVADLIEAQTKPARIPEPEWGAIVKAHSLGAKGDRLRWVKGNAGWTNLDATGEYLNWIDWDNLIDPTLIREGVSS